MTLLLFVAAAVAIAAVWNRWFAPVPWPLVALFLALVIGYQARTLFTDRVDLPGRLAYAAYPWRAVSEDVVRANTGIVFTQLAPWTRSARESLLRGEAPLWNRALASGSPLLANQQTAIFHPFTLIGLLLPLGKAWTLSVCLRLFTLLFFTFVFMRRWVSVRAATFAAVAYTFTTFHIVWLLFPLGLASMMLPVVLAGVNEISERRALRSFALLSLALSLSVLGGHPESACWVWIAGAAYAVYLRRNVLLAAAAFLAAIALTAFFWLPTVELLPLTTRFEIMQSAKADHDLSAEWLLPLLWPNALGTPMAGTYTAPRGGAGVVLSDYGEVASGFAGTLTLLLALAALFVARRRPLAFAFGLALFALLTIAEVPLWRDALRAVPLIGITLHQRLRLFWALGMVIAAACTLDRFPRLALPATIVTLAELVFVTWNYNPPAAPRDVYPVTDAIRAMQSNEPSRIAALGWSFIPDTPGWYGLEDVKTTDPIQHAHYMRLMRGYLAAKDYDQTIGDTSQPFFDFLNIRYVFAPPGEATPGERFALRYQGPDGSVYENTRALPRYFLASRLIVEPSFGMAVARSKLIDDFRTTALVDHIPDKVRRLGYADGGAGGDVRVVDYGANETRLRVSSRGWNLLVTSDAHWPGWRAYWNGQRMPPVVVNGAFVGMFVPPGEGEVVLRYRPKGFETGVRISVAALLVLVGMGVVSARRNQ